MKDKTHIFQSADKNHLLLIRLFAFFLFAMFVAAWLFFFNRYQAIDFREQLQLFRFNSYYFKSFLFLPGGLTHYAGAFLTQFFYYHWLGAVVCALLITAVVFSFSKICQNGEKPSVFSFLPFVTGLLLTFSFVKINHLDLSSFLGLWLALIVMRIYQRINSGWKRYLFGILVLFPLYYLSVGNLWIAVSLFIIYELFLLKKAFSFTKLLPLVVYPLLAFLFPYLSQLLGLFYSMPLELRWGLTPFSFGQDFPSSAVAKAAWCSIPLLYLVSRLLPRSLRYSKAFARTSLGLVVLGSLVSFYQSKTGEEERLYRLMYDVRHGNWQSVLDDTKGYKGTNRLFVYLSNLALAKQSLLSEQMFAYPQYGPAGLFLSREIQYYALLYSGEQYYHLGCMAQAKQYFYEAMVSIPFSKTCNPNAHTLIRLAQISLLQGNLLEFQKYNKPLSESLFYRSVTRESKAEMKKILGDRSYSPKGMPKPGDSENFFINYNLPERDLAYFLSMTPDNKLAFEYITSYLLQKKDLEKFIIVLNECFNGLGYSFLPTHFEEALVLFCQTKGYGDEFFEKYPVRKETRERFANYYNSFLQLRETPYGTTQLERMYGKTFWFYFHFVKPIPVNPNEEQNRY